jgi:hypothetical protein
MHAAQPRDPHDFIERFVVEVNLRTAIWAGLTQVSGQD